MGFIDGCVCDISLEWDRYSMGKNFFSKTITVIELDL